MTELIGLHHITAIMSDAPKIFDFMTNILGLHLIKKNGEPRRCSDLSSVFH